MVHLPLFFPFFIPLGCAVHMYLLSWYTEICWLLPGFRECFICNILLSFPQTHGFMLLFILYINSHFFFFFFPIVALSSNKIRILFFSNRIRIAAIWVYIHRGLIASGAEQLYAHLHKNTHTHICIRVLRIRWTYFTLITLNLRRREISGKMEKSQKLCYVWHFFFKNKEWGEVLCLVCLCFLFVCLLVGLFFWIPNIYP